MRRRLLLPLGMVTATVALILAAGRHHQRLGRPWTFLVIETFSGAMMTSGGVIIWLRRPHNQCGRLLMAAGLSFWFGDFEHASLNVSTMSFSFNQWHVGFLAWAVLAFPLGRLASRPARAMTAAVFGLLTVRTLSRLFLFVPADTAGYGTRNRFVPISDGRWWRDVERWFDRLLPLTMLVALGIVVARWARSSRPGRRMLSPAVVASALLLAAVSYSNLAGWNASLSPRNSIRVYYLVWLSYGLLALTLAAGMERLRRTRSRVVDVFSELHATATPPARLADALRRALGDPTLTLLHWSSEAQAFVDERGAAALAGDVASGRATTEIERDGQPFALLVHDEALLEDPGLVNAVVAAIRLTSDNELLQTELRGRLAEIAASRSRIMEAGDIERQKIERNLHDGAQQRLVTTALTVRLAETRLGDSPDPRVHEVLSSAVLQLTEAIDELRDLARGIHPAVLTEFGLDAALTSLTSRLPIVVRLDVDVPGELPYAASSTAYFAVSEALTNAMKHARATTVTVSAIHRADVLRVEVADDGVGGADLTAGSGLSGIVDRIETVGGTGRVISPLGGGTRIVMELPCASS